MNYLTRIFVLILVLSSSFTYAQTLERTVVGSAGQEQKNSSLNISFTVGEAAITTSKKSSLTITQGFQQSSNEEEGKDTTSIQEKLANSLQISLFPNPTQEWVNVKSDTEQELELIVLDGLGKVVYSQKLSVNSSSENKIEVNNWAVGQYFFNFSEIGSEKQSSFKVLKQ